MNNNKITWKDFYKNGHKLKDDDDNNIHSTWKDMFDNYIFNDEYFNKLEKTLKKEIKERKSNDL